MDSEHQPRPSGTERDLQLGAAIDAYFDARSRGEAVSVTAWCAGHPDLAEELGPSLEALLQLRGAARELPGGRPPSGSVPLPRVQGYRILDLIGRGGMGTVYRAWQVSTKRLIALKVLNAGASDAARQRFEREIELAATLDHPAIVHILEGGETDGVLYCAMEFVKGATLHDYLHARNLGLQEKLELFAQITAAVHYAHLHAVVHRDLKPSNIVVDPDGHPHILDFGLARFAHGGSDPATQVTRTGQIVGTLPYLSPEQASGESGGVDLRSDLYALGVILFEMLTGQLPYDVGGSLFEALDQIRHAMPPEPSRLCKDVGPDLDAVVLKALEKEQEERYQTAAGFGDDVRSVLRGEPVEANRTGAFFLLRKAYARHRRQVQVAALLLGVVLAASALVLVLYVRGLRDRERLRDELHENQLRAAAAHLGAGHDLLAERLLLDAHRDRPDARARWSLKCFYIQNPVVACMTRAGWSTALDTSPDGLTLAQGDLQGRLTLRDARDLTERTSAMAHPSGVRAVAFSPDGERVATTGADGALRIWDAADLQARGGWQAHGAAGCWLRFGPRSDVVFSAGEDGRVVRWKLDAKATAAVLFEQPTGDEMLACDLSADGSRLAIACDNSLLLMNALDGTTVQAWEDLPGPVEAVRFDGRGRRLALWSRARVTLWDIATGRSLWSAPAGLSEPRPTALWNFPAGAEGAPERPHQTWLPRLVFSPDGELLVSTGWDAVARVWKVTTGGLVAELRAHATAIYAACFRPGTRLLATSCVGTVRLWDLSRHPGMLSRQLAPAAERVRVAASSRAGVLAWAGSRDGSLVVQSIQDYTAGGKRFRRLPHPSVVGALAFDPAGRYLACGDDQGAVTLWRLADWGREARFETGSRRVRALAFAPDGSWLVTGGHDGMVRMWSVTDVSPAPLAAWQAHAGQVLTLAVSPDGACLASGGADWRTRIWHATGTHALIQERRHKEWVNATCFSPDGKTVASTGADCSIWLGGTDEATRHRIASSHAHWVTALAFLDGGRVLASAGYDGALRFWDVDQGTELASFVSQGGPIHDLALTNDERFLFLGASRAVQLVDLEAAARHIAR